MPDIHPKDKELLIYGVIIGVVLTIMDYFVITYNLIEEIGK